MSPVPQVSKADFEEFLSRQPLGENGKPQVRRADLEAFLSGSASAEPSKFTRDPFTAAKIGLPLEDGPIEGAEAEQRKAETSAFVNTSLDTAGALAPELMWPAKLVRSLPILKRLGQLFKTSAKGAAGLEAAHVVEEGVGTKPESSLGEKAVDAGINTALGFFVPAAFDAGLTAYRGTTQAAPDIAENVSNWVKNKFGLRPSDLQIASDPAAARATEYLNRNNPQILNRQTGKAARISPTDRRALDAVQLNADRGIEAVGAELGAAGGDTAIEQTLAQNFKRSGKEAVELGVFEGVQDVSQALEKTAALQKQVLGEKTAALAKMDELGIVVKTSDLAPELQALEKRIAELRGAGPTKKFADAIEETRNSILYDPRVSSGLSPSQAAQYQTDLNFLRREILKEFDASPTIFTGQNSPVESAAQKSALEAIQALQTAIGRAVERKLPVEMRGVLPKLNAQYGGLAATEELLHKTAYGTLKGLSARDPTRVVQNAGQENLITAFANNAGLSRSGLVTGAVKTAKDLMGGSQPSEAAVRFAMNAERDKRVIQNVQDMLWFQRNRVQLPPDSPPIPMKPIGMSGPTQAQLGAARQLAMVPSLSSALGAHPEDAQAFPRDTQAIMQNADAFVQRIAEETGDIKLAQSTSQALKLGNPDVSRQVLSQLVKQVPQIFEPSEHPSEMDGIITDPMERDLFSSRIKEQLKSGQISGREAAKQLSALNAGGRILLRQNQPIEAPSFPQQPALPTLVGRMKTAVGERAEYSY